MSSPAAVPPPDDSKSVPSPAPLPAVIDKETKDFSNFLALTFVILSVFAFMIKTSPLPPPHRVLGIVLDAGSTGTRAQLFTFLHDPHSRRLQLHSTRMFHSPKSVAAAAPGEVAPVLRPLLEKVKKAVPGTRRRQRTPIALRATAGVRMLGEERAESRLQEVRAVLNRTDFLFQEEWVGVLEGVQEAAHAWTSVNYLKGGLHGGQPIVGALELGGASMQVVYRDNGKESGEERGVLRGSATTVDVFGEAHVLRSSSHLGLGLLDFSKRLMHLFEREGVLEEGNPCFRRDKLFENKELRFGVPGSEETRVVNMTGDGDFGRCVASAEIAMASHGGLSDVGAGLPAEVPFVAYAFFYDRVVGFGLKATPTADEMEEKGRELCEAPPVRFVKGDSDEACAEFSYVYALLKRLTGGFQRDVGSVRFEQYVDGHMLGWALGAVLEIVQPGMQRQLALDHEGVFLT